LFGIACRKANSIATIFSLDIYKKAINKNADDKKLVSVGKNDCYHFHDRGHPDWHWHWAKN